MQIPDAPDTAVAGRPDWAPGRYKLKDAWFPVAHPHEVKAKPIRRLIHSQPYFLWRDQGSLQASVFHPNEPVNHKKYAGEFSGRFGRYPIVERFASVWVWYGDPANADESLVPDIPYMPRFGRLPSWMYDWIRYDACAELSVENLLDLTHADFLHSDISGDEISETDQVSVQTTSETITMIREVTRKKTPKFMRLMGVKTDYQDFRGVVHIHVRSSSAIVFGEFTPGLMVPLFSPNVPESSLCCRMPSLFNMIDAPIPYKWIMPRMARMVGPQDNKMMQRQNPRYLARSNRRDFHSRFDGAGVAYRHLIQQIQTRQSKGDFSYQEDGHPGCDISGLLRIKRVHDRTGRGLNIQR